MLFLLVVSFPVTMVWSACLPTTGPAGAYDCYSGKFYNYQPQWATCVTNAYLSQKSKGRYKCRDSQRTYCYYQCMLEMHDQDRGNVTSDCACDPDNPMTTQPSPPDVITLPPYCFSPNGTDCGWYQDCLDARFQCSGGEDDYGILYGEAFCQLYERRYASFSQPARNWINNVRKCLQVELVPLLRPFESPSCSDVKTRAFSSHTGCYVTPFRDVSSICDLSLGDFWKVFWTIRVAFRSDFVESVLRLMEVKQECDNLSVRQIDAKMRKLMVTLNLPLPSRRKRFAYSDPPSSDTEHESAVGQFIRKLKSTREASSGFAKLSASSELKKHQLLGPETSTRHSDRRRNKREITPGGDQQGDNSAELYYHRMAAEVCDDLARQLHWDAEHVLWFAYGVYLGDKGDLQVHILLADKTLSSPNATGANLTATVGQMVEAFRQGDVSLDVGGKNLHSGMLSSCEDLGCQEVSVNVTAPRLTSMAALSVVNWSSLSLTVALLCWRPV